ncbi:MAG: hypothetical protein OEZ58_22665 [Gammaproteobacteria bacterium]|nr:hypothetical protein [Gammaproteobacteria bacterium]MDH5731795.1 hypothetical protein [Gammaproteobacteria bacterium]
MIRNIFIALILLILCIPLSSLADEDIEFYVIDSGGQSGINHQMLMVADNAETFSHLWMMHTKNQVDPQIMPRIDFTSHMVIGQFLGYSASCGYQIYTNSVEFDDGQLEVESNVVTPVGEIQCLIAETPFEIISVPRLSKLVKFEMEIE